MYNHYDFVLMIDLSNLTLTTLFLLLAIQKSILVAKANESKGEAVHTKAGVTSMKNTRGFAAKPQNRLAMKLNG